MRLEWSPAALLDLERFAEFLERRFPRISATIAADILRKVETLCEFPLRGRLVHADTPYREFPLHVANATYVLQYRIDGDLVVVLRVFHGSEDRSDP